MYSNRYDALDTPDVTNVASQAAQRTGGSPLEDVPEQPVEDGGMYNVPSVIARRGVCVF